MNTVRKTVDIIIPVFNRSEVLRKTLYALAKQVMPMHWSARIIVSDDGSTEDVKSVVNAFDDMQDKIGSWQQSRFIQHSHQGIAKARNAALGVVSADIIVFLGADILLLPNALLQHVQFHEMNPNKNVGGLGFVKWDPRLYPSPIAEWMNHGGPQNDFDSLLGRIKADPKHFFYASHVSVKRDFIKGVFFDERYTSYGWEDLDMGNRLSAQGMHLFMLHQAIGLHHHRYTVQDIERRQRLAGRSFQLYRQTYPKLCETVDVSALRRMKHMFAELLGLYSLARMLVVAGQRYVPARVFAFLASHWFLIGFWQTSKKQ